ncbi:beta-1,6-N-acetylglucosaminyltransferase [Nonlabens sp. Asnod2-A12]|uniref:beta-1,6-N-acetylglucosaminyltransferase n=1 Tax=Nonlabens sp. Asnod2-A12 TaxID=3160578 RepID=UPI0038695298
MKKLAYAVMAHDDPIHLNKIINALNYNADFYIHIDLKSDIKSFHDLIDRENVFFIKDRVSVAWAGITMVDALMNLIKDVLKSGNDYSHVVFKTGTCYPIKNVQNIYRELTSNPEKEYINFIDMKDSPEHYSKLVYQKWFREPLFNYQGKFLKTIDRGLRFLLNQLKLKNYWNEEIVPYTGHTWCAITMNCCEYIYNYHENNPWFREMNKFTMAADEHYFHTIIGNSKFKDFSQGKSEYKGRGLYQYTSIYLIDKSLTKWYDLNDWEEISNSDKFFVRKISSKTGSSLIDKINTEILGVSEKIS